MQNLNGAALIKHTRVVNYIKTFITPSTSKQVKIKESAPKNPLKFTIENKDQIFTEIKNLLDDL